jgi:hypothetical protein
LTLELYLAFVVRCRGEELVVGVMLDVFVNHIPIVIRTKDSLDVSVWAHVRFLVVFQEDGKTREARRLNLAVPCWTTDENHRQVADLEDPAFVGVLENGVEGAFAQLAALKMSTHLENGAVGSTSWT